MTRSSTRSGIWLSQRVEDSPPEEVADWGLIKDKIQTALRRFFRKRTQRRPMILPVVMEG